MKSLVFDPSYGCAGDMILGAFISAGVEFDALRSGLSKLNLSGYSISTGAVRVNDISAAKVTVQSGETSAHRHLRDIHQIIESSALNEAVKTNARRIFQRLAEAEAEVHSTTPESIHFHEVGAVDAIIDIAGACLCIDILGIDKIYSRPIALGAGTVDCEHGTFPVPAPATANLVRGFPVRMYNLNAELTTPTGAAIVTTLAEPLYSAFEGSMTATGYGAGTRTLENHPNLMRIFLVDDAFDYNRDSVFELQANIDDMNPQVYSFLFDKLMAAGALDVSLIPVYMKKNRPGQILTVLCEPDKLDTLQKELFAQTSTSGIRYGMRSRVKLPRRSETISTPLGDCRVKVFEFFERTKVVPEYESVKRIADSKQMPYLEAYDAITNFLIDMEKEQ